MGVTYDATSVGRAVARALDPKYFNLILFATEQCNFRCLYCYEDFKIGRMRPAVVQGVKALVSARAAHVDQLTISWFGGEPLLALNVVRELSRHICDLAAPRIGRSAGIAYEANMTTNGFLLTVPVVQELAGLGIRRFQVTLDGDGMAHDSVRPLASGRPTFDRIWANLLAFRDCECDATIMLRIHVAAANRAGLKDFVAKAGQAFGHDPRFEFHFMPVEHFGGPNDGKFELFPADELDQFIDELRAQLPGGSAITDLKGQPEPFVCYAASVNSLAIRADGSLAKCTVALNDDRNRIGHILPDGMLSVDQRRLGAWVSPLVTGDLTDLACPMGKVLLEPMALDA